MKEATFISPSGEVLRDGDLVRTIKIREHQNYFGGYENYNAALARIEEEEARKYGWRPTLDAEIRIGRLRFCPDFGCFKLFDPIEDKEDWAWDVTRNGLQAIMKIDKIEENRTLEHVVDKPENWDKDTSGRVSPKAKKAYGEVLKIILIKIGASKED